MCIHNGNLNGNLNCQQCLGGPPNLGSNIGNNIGNFSLTYGATGTATSLNAYTDQEYVMFKTYAHLDDGKIMETFLEEQKLIEYSAKAQAEAILATGLLAKEQHELRFASWLSRYKKHITIERIRSLKAFL